MFHAKLPHVVTATINTATNARQVEAFNAFWGMVAHYEACKAVTEENAERALKGLPPLPMPAPVNPSDELRQFFYGGAIRGGKTFLYLTIFCLLCKKYPGSRWHVIRQSFTQLSGITESSLQKIIGPTRVKWKRSSRDYYVQFRNGSRIYFFSENYNQDPLGTRFLGLETNGILLEQMEELRHNTLQQCLMRAGSWYIPNQPPTVILGTFNPTYCWVKEHIYDRWVVNPDACEFHYTTALPKDNTKVTAEQWKQWENLDPVTYQRFIEGLWEIDIKGRFFYAFDENRHKRDVQYDKNYPLWYSYDFNVDPSCAIVFQTDKRTFFHILDEVRIEDGDTPAVCDTLKTRWGGADPVRWKGQPPSVRITGDASGLARMSGLKGHLNQYQVIKRELDIPEERFILSETNPEIPDSRVFVNSVWSRFPNVYIHPRCKYTIHDLNFLQIRRDQEGRVHIQKTGKNIIATMNAESMGHLGDCSRYGMHTTLHDFVTIPRS